MRSPTDIIYVAIDGDNIGSNIELFILENQMTGLQEYSNKFNSAIDWLIQSFMSECNAEVYLKGGDSILVGVPSDSKIGVVIEGLRKQFAEKTGNTISVGIGESPLHAYLALKYAKASGKNLIKYYSEIKS